MRADIRKFILQCPYCQKMAHIKTAIHSHPFTTASYSMMDRIAIDTIGPLPTDQMGNGYIITMIDCFSRVIELIATPDTKAVHAAKALYTWACRYGIPSQIVTDNGSQYANELITTFCNFMDVDHSLIQAYSHEENGIVERANKEVLRHLRSIIFDKNILQEWGDYLPMVQRIINAQVHESIGVSPIELLYGNAISLDRRHLFSTHVTET